MRLAFASGAVVGLVAPAVGFFLVAVTFVWRSFYRMRIESAPTA